MDPKERQRKEALLHQGQGFVNLSSHPDWFAFRAWMEQARNDYERLLHHPDERASGVSMARWAEGYDALNNILTNFDRSMRRIPELTRELEEEDSGRADEKYTTTGRKVS